MKGRLRKSPLPQPKIPLTGKQSLAKKPAALSDDMVLHEVLIIADQHRFDQVWMVQEINMDPSLAIVEDIAEFLSSAHVKHRGASLSIEARVIFRLGLPVDCKSSSHLDSVA